MVTIIQRYGFIETIGIGIGGNQPLQKKVIKQIPFEHYQPMFPVIMYAVGSIRLYYSTVQ